MSKTEDQAYLRFVIVNGAKYLRAEDVASFVISLGASEDTDVRRRLEEAARRLTRREAP